MWLLTTLASKYSRYGAILGDEKHWRKLLGHTTRRLTVSSVGTIRRKPIARGLVDFGLFFCLLIYNCIIKPSRI